MALGCLQATPDRAFRLFVASAVNRRVAGWGASGYSDGERPNGTPTTAFPKCLRQFWGPNWVQLARFWWPMSGLNGAESTVSVKLNSRFRAASIRFSAE